MTREYYEINEDAARQAKAMWSHSDYVMGRTKTTICGKSRAYCKEVCKEAGRKL